MHKLGPIMHFNNEKGGIIKTVLPDLKSMLLVPFTEKVTLVAQCTLADFIFLPPTLSAFDISYNNGP